jgi:hypothetical protein
MAKHALCVGINKFKNIPQANWLEGCVNDALDVAAMLTKAGFPEANITVLTDSAATKKGVYDALKAMVTSASSGDQVVFSFSSHGTQVPDTNGDETDDHMDEAFVCYDLAQQGSQWDTSTVLVDDELHDLFAKAAKGVLIEVVLDTCHSGTGTRDLEDLLRGDRPKFLPPDPAKVFHPAPATRGLDLSEASPTTDPKAVGAPDPKSLRDFVKAAAKTLGPVLYAACQANQTSADATFAGRANGAFTYYWLKALAVDPTRSRTAVVAETTTNLAANSYDQRPSLEGPAKAKKAPVGGPW